MSEYYHAPIPKNGPYGYFSPLLNLNNETSASRKITNKNSRGKNQTSLNRANPSITIPPNKTNTQSAASSSMMRIPPRAVSVFLDKIETCFNIKLQVQDLACPADVLEVFERSGLTRESLSVLKTYLEQTQRLTEQQLELLNSDDFWEKNIFCEQPKSMGFLTHVGASIDHLHRISWKGIKSIHARIEADHQSPWVFALKHSLYSLEVVALAARLKARHPDRPIMILIHHVFSSLPFFDYLRQLGLRVGCDHEVTSAFANKGIVLVFPGGAKDMMLGDRTTHYLGKGFLRLAEIYRAHVVMVSGQESLNVYRKFPLIPRLGDHFKLGLPLSAIAPNGSLFLGLNAIPHPKPFTFCLQELKLPENSDENPFNLEAAHESALELIKVLINKSKESTENTDPFIHLLLRNITYYSLLLELVILFVNNRWENDGQLMDQTTPASMIFSVGINNVSNLAFSAGALAACFMKDLCPSLAQQFSRSTALFSFLQLAAIVASVGSVLDQQIARGAFCRFLLGVFFGLSVPGSFDD